jgi:LmbE family N-acetylglucosaminyl deacetylase
MILRRVLSLLAACAMLTAPRAAAAQERGAAALDQLLRGLPVTARVLMVGAHPDDEDTQLLAWLVRGHQVHAAYLSLTRGDGGQNEIGNDLGEALGAIRTEELLAARRVDGAQQFFSRAYDFGFSKNADETFRQWDREALAGDVVRVIRAYRPHVIVSVFSGTPTDGHGHHQAAGILAREGFESAADTVRFPPRTHGQPWEPSKFYRGAWSRNAPHTMDVEVGGYDPVLGRSPAEIAGESRSQHRSQGFGSLQRRGSVRTRVRRELSRVNEGTPATEERSLFDGVDTSFARLARAVPDARAALDSAAALIAAISAAVDLRRPDPLVAPLALLVQQLDVARAAMRRCGFLPPRVRRGDPLPPACTPGEMDFQVAVERAHERAQRALLEAAGLALEATAAAELVAFGDSVPTRITVYNRGRTPVTVHELTSTGLPPRRFDPVTVMPDSSHTFERRALGLVDHRPWWVGERANAMFRDSRSPADGVALISYGDPAGLVPSVSVAEDTRRLSDVRLAITVAGVRTTASAGELIHRYADPVLGEQQRPVGGVPPVTIDLDRGLEYIRADVPVERRIRVTLRSHTDRERVLATRLLVPAGLRAEGVPDTITLAPGETRELFVTLKGRLPEGRHEFGLGAESEGTLYTEGFRTIEYPHIRPQRLYRSAGMYLQAVRVTAPRRLSVLYVSGLSDAVAPALRQVDVPVQVVAPADLQSVDLSRFSTVVIGPRAYEANADLRAFNPRLLDWVRGGGTMVVQYGQFEMPTPGLMPYPIRLTRPAARVTLEDAPVQVMDAQSRLLAWPNRLGDADWAGWVQERALYMPTDIDPQYRTPLGMHDPGEPLNLGAILDAPVGRGRYIYTTLSLFRQIPGGVPGGLRVLVNLLSAGLPAGQ